LGAAFLVGEWDRIFYENIPPHYQADLNNNPSHKKTGWVRYLLADTPTVFPQKSDQMQVAGHCTLITSDQEDIVSMYLQR